MEALNAALTQEKIDLAKEKADLQESQATATTELEELRQKLNEV